MKIEVGSAPDRVVLVEVLKAKHVESDDDRQWTYMKNVSGYRLWVGNIE